MIKRLKRKYTLIVMCAVIAVLGVIITAINLVSYSAVNAQLDEKLLMLIDNEGKMPDFPPPEIPSVDDEIPDGDTENGEGDDTEAPGSSDSEKTEGTEEGESDTGNGGDKTENETDRNEEEEEEDPRQSMSPENPL